MQIKEIIKDNFMSGYATNSITLNVVVVCMVCTLILACYIYSVYKLVNKNSFYNKNFNLSLIIIALITAAIILTIQSNIVVSLGMVGALSIVRFRTAIKDPMDLAFLFWSISAGIICGAGFFLIAAIVSIVITIILFMFSKDNATKESQALVINANTYLVEDEIIRIVENNTQYMKVKAKNISSSNLNMAIEVKIEQQSDIVKQLMAIEGVTNVSIVEHDGEITA